STNGGAVGQTRRAELGGGPVLRATSPGQGSVVQCGPEQDSDQDPGLERDVLLVEALADVADGVVQQRPEFTFHGRSPWQKSLPSTTRRNVNSFTSSTL